MTEKELNHRRAYVDLEDAEKRAAFAKQKRALTLKRAEIEIAEKGLEHDLLVHTEEMKIKREQLYVARAITELEKPFGSGGGE